MTIVNGILETIGRTPVVRLNRLAPPGVNVYVKLEAANPMGSVKDRMAKAMIEEAEATGALKPGQTVIEASSGNTGIALAMVCASKGYPLVVVMAEHFSVERRKLMRFLGARVVLTPASEKGSGMLAKAAELAEAHGWFLCNQFENQANIHAHMATTAQEILADFGDRSLDYWVSGAGTGGTLVGVARVLREHSPHTRIALCEPDNAPVLASGLPQPTACTPRAQSHPMFRPHPVQGWTPDFIPAITQSAIDAGLIDEIVPIDGNDAFATARALAREEGILAGISGGATLAGALAIARRAPAGTNILCMLPDTGERYLSTPLFADIEVEMSTEEREISTSTPNFRFDAPACAAPVPGGAVAPAAPVPGAAPVVPVRSPHDAGIEREVAAILDDPGTPVVVFALAWCEFCWSVRRLLTALDVPHRVIDLDAVAMQADERGYRMRAHLNELTGSPTIPQIFVGGCHLGGCMDLVEAYESGRLTAELFRTGIVPSKIETDARSFLPGWLHERPVGRAAAVGR
jgi:cysteine synthase